MKSLAAQALSCILGTHGVSPDSQIKLIFHLRSETSHLQADTVNDCTFTAVWRTQRV